MNPKAIKFAFFLCAIALCLVISLPLCAQRPFPQRPLGWGSKSVVSFDPALNSLVSPDAKLELVSYGEFGFTEGSHWVQNGKDGYLLFTDIPMNVINKMTPDGKVSVFLERAGYDGPITGFEFLGPRAICSINSNRKHPSSPDYLQFVMVGADGLTTDREGRVLAATYCGRSVIRIEKDGKRTLLADRWEGKRFSGPNDLVVKKDGAIYFTDTVTGMREGEKDPSRDLDSKAIYMIKDSKVSRVIHDLSYSNGLALSPDEKYLYVTNGRGDATGENTAKGSAGQIRRYEVQPDDTVKNGQLLIDLDEVNSREGGQRNAWGVDGMRVDSKGNIYSAGPEGVWIISPEGKHLGTIRVPEKAANVTFGDPDYKTLYIPARGSIYKIRVITPGIPCHSCSSE
jgi:gluconolactonase